MGAISQPWWVEETDKSRMGQSDVRGENGLIGLSFPVILGWCKQDSITTRH